MYTHGQRRSAALAFRHQAGVVFPYDCLSLVIPRASICSLKPPQFIAQNLTDQFKPSLGIKAPAARTRGRLVSTFAWSRHIILARDHYLDLPHGKLKCVWFALDTARPIEIIQTDGDRMLRLVQPSPSITAASAPCPQCGEAMDIKLVEPHPMLSKKEKRTFECKECGLPRTYIMKLN